MTGTLILQTRFNSVLSSFETHKKKKQRYGRDTGPKPIEDDYKFVKDDGTKIEVKETDISVY